MENKNLKKHSSLILIDIDKQEEAILQKEVNAWRWFHIMAGFGIPISWIPIWLVEPNAYDPLALRFALGVLSIIFVGITFSKKIDKRIMIYLNYIWYGLGLVWIIWLNYMNSLSGNFILGIALMISGFTSVYFRKAWHLNVMVGATAAALIVMALLVKDPKVGVFSFLNLLLIASLLSYFSVKTRLRTHKELTDSWIFVSRIFEESQDCIMVSDFDTWENLYCNKAAITLFGLSGKEEVIGKHGPEFIPGGVSLKNAEEAKKALKEKGVHRREAVYSTKDGRQFSADVIVSVLTVGNDKYLLSRISDVSKIKKAEIGQVKAFEQLQKMNEIMTGRELAMAELKKENEELKRKCAEANIK